MKSTEPITLTCLTEKHLDGALALSQAEGWPHRLSDWKMAYSISKGVVALNNTKVVGTALASVFGDVAMINMVIVDESARGHGIGQRLMKAVSEFAGNRATRLFATDSGYPLYSKLGFISLGANHQLQGKVTAIEPELTFTKQSQSLDALIEMDTKANGMNRATLLEHLLSQGTVFSAETGFAILRPFGQGYVIGPVVADTPTTAKSLIAVA